MEIEHTQTKIQTKNKTKNRQSNDLRFDLEGVRCWGMGRTLVSSGVLGGGSREWRLLHFDGADNTFSSLCEPEVPQEVNWANEGQREGGERERK